MRKVLTQTRCGATKAHAEVPCSNKISVSYCAETGNPIKTTLGLNQLCFTRIEYRHIKYCIKPTLYWSPSPHGNWDHLDWTVPLQHAVVIFNWNINKWEVFPGLRASCWWITLHTKIISDIHHTTSLCKTNHL